MNDDDFHLSIPDIMHTDFRWTTGRREFCYHMARVGDARKAAELAGMSPASGPGLFQLEPIREAVQKELQRLLTVSDESEESVIARWSKWASADISKFVENDWSLKTVDQIDPEYLMCIKKVKVTRNAHGINTEIELHDAHKANNDLAVMMGLLGKGDGDLTPPEETAQSIQRALQEMMNVNGLQELKSGEEQEGTARVTH